jgi:hypothetical protein
LKSYRNGNVTAGIPHTVFYSWYHKVIDELLPRCQVIVLCSVDRPDQIFGWMVAEKVQGLHVIHYIYVKGPFQKLGAASKLVETFLGGEEDPVVVITHMTGPARWVLEHTGLKKKWVYNPFWLFASLKPGWAGLMPVEVK